MKSFINGLFGFLMTIWLLIYLCIVAVILIIMFIYMIIFDRKALWFVVNSDHNKTIAE